MSRQDFRTINSNKSVGAISRLTDFSPQVGGLKLNTTGYQGTSTYIQARWTLTVQEPFFFFVLTAKPPKQTTSYVNKAISSLNKVTKIKNLTLLQQLPCFYFEIFGRRGGRVPSFNNPKTVAVGFTVLGVCIFCKTRKFNLR